MTVSHRFLRLLLLLAIPTSLLAVDGKALFRDNCKVCHDKGSKNGVYTPMSLTQDQWRRFFATKLVPSHKTAIHPATHKNLLEGLTPAELKAIQDFAVDHAADSEQPATCG